MRLGGAVAQLGERLVRNEEVSGSIPLGSTSLRRTAASAGKPRRTKAARCSYSEGGLVISTAPNQFPLRREMF